MLPGFPDYTRRQRLLLSNLAVYHNADTNDGERVCHDGVVCTGRHFSTHGYFTVIPVTE